MNSPQTIIVALLALTPYAAQAAGPMDKYFTDPKQRPRYYIAPEEGPLVGNQKLLLLTPEMLKPGVVAIRLGKTANESPRGFDLTTESLWGDLTYRIEANPSGDGAKLAAYVKKMAGTANKLIGGKITRIEDGGKSLAVTVGGEGNDGIPCTFKLMKRESPKKKGGVLPDIASRQYGPHAQQQFDVYYPKNRGSEPLPVMIFVHGGGWSALDKNIGSKGSVEWTSLGMAYVAVNYRFAAAHDTWPAVNPPVAAPLLDAARCVQYLRYHAKELGLDMSRACMTGGSAGGATTCWIAMHGDMADPDSDDPIARQSTRIALAIPCQAQTSLDPVQMRAWIPTITYGSHAFFDRGTIGEGGEEAFQYFLAHREQIVPWIKEFSPYEHASKDDPPMLLNYKGQEKANPPVDAGNATHSPMFGEHLRDRLKELGVEVWFKADNVKCENPRYDGAKGDQNFVIDHFFGGKDSAAK